MTNLNATITSLAENFARELVQALRSLSLSEILAETRGGTSAAAVRAPAAKTKGKAKSGGGGAVSVDAIVSMLKKHKDGMRAEVLRRELGAAKPAFNYHVAKAIAENKITKRGVKRSTTYRAR